MARSYLVAVIHSSVSGRTTETAEPVSEPNDESDEQSDQQPEHDAAPGEAVPPVAGPEGSWFNRLPMAVKIGGPIIIAVLVIGWWTARGETTAEDLAAGDCFEIPTSDAFEVVQDQGCDGEHDAEVVAVVQAPEGTGWPGSGNVQAAVAAEEACFLAIDQLTLDEDNIPPDAELGFFFTDERNWNDDDRQVICYVTAPTGLVGSVVATRSP